MVRIKSIYIAACIPNCNVVTKEIPHSNGPRMKYGTPIVSSSDAVKNLAARFKKIHGSLQGFTCMTNPKAYMAPLSQ